MGQPVAMFEVISEDRERAQQFYSSLFDWTIQTDETMGDYALVDTGAGKDAVIGGFGPSENPGDTGVKIYMRVGDLDAYLARAEELGGSRLVEPTKLPGGYGSFAMIADPDGNAVGLWS
ncbi:hypothetical protein GCM10027052_05180 [Parafrigoribacterium mesophilum]|uniref:VOC family protein n=1 Tax=Parafrigoribacterium mesophilum TaxID=433646 RepID=UPI0031FC0C7D